MLAMSQKKVKNFLNTKAHLGLTNMVIMYFIFLCY